MIPDTSAPDQAARTERSRRSSVPPLRRETITVVNDRARAGMLMGLLALGGVSLGFGLASLGAQHPHSYCSMARQARLADAATPHPSLALAGPVETQGWLGVHIRDHRTESTAGARVISVFHNSAAERAGLERGDLVVGFEGVVIEDASDLVRAVRMTAAGSPVLLQVVRDGQRLQIEAELDQLHGMVGGVRHWSRPSSAVHHRY